MSGAVPRLTMVDGTESEDAPVAAAAATAAAITDVFFLEGAATILQCQWQNTILLELRDVNFTLLCRWADIAHNFLVSYHPCSTPQIVT